jgi:hypothetical protein
MNFSNGLIFENLENAKSVQKGLKILDYILDILKRIRFEKGIVELSECLLLFTSINAGTVVAML